MQKLALCYKHDDKAVYIHVAEYNARKEKKTLDNAKVSFMLQT